MSSAQARLFASSVLAACALASPAFALDRITVLPFKGQMSARAHDSVASALDDAGGYEVVSAQLVARTADSLGADLSSAKGRVTVARELRLSALVEGNVRKRGAKLEVQLTVYSGATGQAIGVTSVAAKKPALQRTLRSRSPDELGPLLSQGAAPGAAEPEPEPEPVEQAEPEPEPAPAPVRKRAPVEEERAARDEGEGEDEDAEESGPRPKAFELDLGLRLLTRGMKYNDAPLDLAEQSNEITPTLALGLRWYPGAHFGGGAAAHVGLDVTGQLTYPIDSTRGEDSFKTSSHAFGVGLHGRLPVGAHELGLTLGYGQHAVEIADSDGGVDPGVPSVKYGFLRAGLDARFQLSDALALRLGAGYRLLLSYGELAEDAWFQRTSGAGVDAEIGLRYLLTGPLALEASFGIWRYGLSLEPDPSDDSVTDFARIAGGITDQSLYGGIAGVLEF